MRCEDNSSLRIPLNEVCQTTDIGCVPATNGKPQCNPQPDELPLAYDKSTSTLWLFDCDTREWIAHTKFSMDQLQDLNLDNIKNICDLLKIGVYYNPGTGNIQGTITLAEFTEKLLECLKLETNVVTISQGENNTISINIEGLDGLPPFYVKGDNVWFTGSGTQTDPLIAHTYDPMCKWDAVSQDHVDAATVKHLGACLDGKSVRIPFTDNLFQKPLCELPTVNQNQVTSAANATLAACVDGQVVRIPVPSGMFTPEYLCVPMTSGTPAGAPQFGTGPLRVGCNNELWVWLCESDGSGKWVEVRNNPNALASLNVNNVVDLCNNFRMMGWYSDTTGDPCVREVKMTLKTLVSALNACGLVTQDDLAKYFNYAFRPIIHSMTMTDGKFTYSDHYSVNWNVGIYIKDIVLDEHGFACYAVHDQRFIVGSGDNSVTSDNVPAGGEIDSGEFYDVWVGERYHGLKQVVNPFDRPVTLQVIPGATVYYGEEQPQKYSGGVLVTVTDDPGIDDFKLICGWHQVFVDGRLVRQSCENGAGDPTNAKATTNQTYNSAYWERGGRGGQPNGSFDRGVTNNASYPKFFTIPANSTKDLYMRMWVTWYANRYDANGNPIPEAERIKTLSSGGSWGITGTLQCSIFPQ